MKLKKIILFVLLNGIFILGVDAASLEFENSKTLTINQNSTEDIKIKLKDDGETINRVEFDLIEILYNYYYTFLYIFYL